ncbi:hypothetical protein Tco_1308746, partial [Tanacetum coccineum]
HASVLRHMDVSLLSLGNDEDVYGLTGYIMDFKLIEGERVKEKQSGATDVLAKATTRTSNVQNNVDPVVAASNTFDGSNTKQNKGRMLSPDVVNDGMDSGPSTDLFVDPKVVEGVDKPVLESISNVKVSTIPKSFASLVTNEAVTSKF